MRRELLHRRRREPDLGAVGADAAAQEQTGGIGAPGRGPSMGGITDPSSGKEPTWTPAFNPYSGHGHYNPFAGWSWPSFWPFGGGGSGGAGGSTGGGTGNQAVNESGWRDPYGASGGPQGNNGSSPGLSPGFDWNEPQQSHRAMHPPERSAAAPDQPPKLRPPDRRVSPGASLPAG